MEFRPDFGSFFPDLSLVPIAHSRSGYACDQKIWMTKNSVRYNSKFKFKLISLRTRNIALDLISNLDGLRTLGIVTVKLS